MPCVGAVLWRVARILEVINQQIFSGRHVHQQNLALAVVITHVGTKLRGIYENVIKCFWKRNLGTQETMVEAQI